MDLLHVFHMEDSAERLGVYSPTDGGGGDGLELAAHDRLQARPPLSQDKPRQGGPVVRHGVREDGEGGVRETDVVDVVQDAGFPADDAGPVVERAVGVEGGSHIELVGNTESALFQAVPVEPEQPAAIVAGVVEPGEVQVHVAQDEDAGVGGGEFPDGLVQLVQVLLLQGTAPLAVDGGDHNRAAREVQPQPDLHGGGLDRGGGTLISNVISH